MMKTLLRVFALLVVFALIPIGGLSEANPRRAYEGTELNVLLKTGYETSAITEFQQEFEDATGITLNIEIYEIIINAYTKEIEYCSAASLGEGNG